MVTNRDPGDKFITGVYNYCDRFCERCTLTRRCRVYADEKVRVEEHKKKGEDPHDWAVVLDDVKKEFEKTIRLIREAAEKEGIDLESNPDSPTPAESDPSTHPLHKLSRQYMAHAHRFLENLRKKIETFRQDLAVCAGTTPDSVTDLKKIITDYETVLWFHTLVPAKIHRALTAQFEAAEDSTSDFESDDASADDAAGSAKVAYYGLERSISALQALYEWEKDDEILTLLVLADRMRQMLDREIPGHRSFHHPWFEAHQIP